MKRLALPLTIALAGTIHAQTFDGYLKLRKSYGILQAAQVEALDAFVGTRVIEIQGTIKGSMKINGRTMLMLEKPDGQSEVIETPNPPDWLVGNEVPARLIVRAHREDELARIHVDLLGAAPEADVHAVDLAYAKRLEEERKRLASRSNNLRTTTRPPKAAKEWFLPASEVTPIYANFIRNYNRHVSLAKAMQIAQAVIGFSLRYGVDARLIMALLIAESGFNSQDTSHTGAMGLGQLMPGTARELGVQNPYDTTENLYGTVKLLSRHLNTYKSQTGDDFESLVLALAAYNAGPGAVRRHGGVPPYRETQRYIKRIVSLYNGFCGRR